MMTTRSSRVLVLSDDPVLAALLGMFAELAEYTPAFAAPGERAEDAIARVRPLSVVLLDGALEDVRSDVFFANAAKHRVGVAIVNTPGSAQQLAREAERRHVPTFAIPTDFDAFRRVIAAAAESEWWRSVERRASEPGVRTTHAVDGTLIYIDRGGRRWRVYDRRGGQRRAQQRNENLPAHEEPARERLFIGDDGETLRYLLEPHEEEERNGEALERQIARAEKI